MNITLHLILAHFIADFPCQSNWLARYKQDHLLGIFMHSLTHFAVSLLFVLPFVQVGKVWWGIAIIFILHNLLDYAKIEIQKKHKKWDKFLMYILDQIGHMLVIGWVGIYYLGSMTPHPSFPPAYFGNMSIINFLLALTLVTYFYDVTRWTYLNNKKARPYKRDYKMMGRNALIVIIAFVVYWTTGGAS